MSFSSSFRRSASSSGSNSYCNNEDGRQEFPLAQLGNMVVSPLTLISRVGTLVTRPILKMGEIFTIQEHEHHNHHHNHHRRHYNKNNHNYQSDDDLTSSLQNELMRMSLEGTLYHRRGRSHKWKRRLVILKFQDGASFECYKINNKGSGGKDTAKQLFKDVYSQVHRQASVGSTIHQMESKELKLILGRDSPWIVRDIENDPSTFVIEIPTTDPNLINDLLDQDHPDDHDDRIDLQTDSFDLSEDGYSSSGAPVHYTAPLPSSPTGSSPAKLSQLTDHSTLSQPARDKLQKDFLLAHKKNRPLRFYFKCPRKGNEKALWLRGFAKVNRLSQDSWNKRKVFGMIAHVGTATSRLRKDAFAQFNRDARHLEMGGDMMMSPQYRSMQNNKRAMPTVPEQVDRREFRVYPGWCYPHVWMTKSELREECNLPSTQFHDLRLDAIKGQEIGTLNVEVLQCMGLPKSSVTDTVCYLVCGSYAFATDAIPNNANPYWLRKARRACTFPIFHGYARLFVGVFDDISGPKDTLVGRVVIDLSKLRPKSRYDVTLPLRDSAQVYSRRKHGVIRLRFQLDWKSVPKALTSYLPRTLKIPKKTYPDTRTTVMCTDPASFHNIAHTVHGAHLPGKFSLSHFRAAVKEVTYSRKMAMLIARTTVIETMTYVNPAISTFVFGAWMHCIYRNSFGLVPAYVTTFVMIHLFRNYSLYAMDGPSSRGFVPPSWEEMFFAATLGIGIQPLSMTPRGESKTMRSPLDDDDEDVDDLDDEESVMHKIETHQPWGKSFFRAVGFLESQEQLEQMSPNERNLEFPYANGKVYPKMSVLQAMAPKRAISRKAPPSKLQEDAPRGPSTARSYTGEQQIRLKNNNPPHTLRRSDVEDNASQDGNLTLRFNSIDEECTGSITGDDDPYSIHEGSIGNQYGAPDTYDIDDPDMLPTQDIDYNVVTGDKKMTDDLNEIKHNMHRMTWHLFNHSTHVVRHPEAVYFGYGKRGTRRKHVDRDLQKLLGVGYYSSGNYLMARVAVYIAPLLDSSASVLCAFRAIFNIFTWRDSYFSFWVSFFGVLLAGILFVFPWRLFMLCVGLFVVGPQNFVIRLIRERRGKVAAEDAVDENALSCELPSGQPLFKAHSPANMKHREVNPNDVDPREVHHVVVPYSPWSNVGTRFNDWPPPDNQYCCVRHKPTTAACPGTFLSGDSSSHSLLPGGVPHYILAEISGPATRRRSFSTDCSLTVNSSPPMPSRRSRTLDGLDDVESFRKKKRQSSDSLKHGRKRSQTLEAASDILSEPIPLKTSSSEPIPMKSSSSVSLQCRGNNDSIEEDSLTTPLPLKTTQSFPKQIISKHGTE